MTDPSSTATGPTWRWRQVGLQLPPLGASLALAADDRQATLVAARADGGPVEQVVIGPDGDAERRPSLPLVSVSGAARGPRGVVVGGAADGTGAAVVCEVDPGTGEAAATELPVDGRLAAWPVPVATDPVQAVWATTRGDAATLWCGTLTAGGVGVAQVDLVTPVWALQAEARDAAVDVLCQTPAGDVLVRLGAGVGAGPVPVDEGTDAGAGRAVAGGIRLRDLPAGARLAPGVVLAARGDLHLDVWDTADGTHHEVALPAPGRDASDRVDAPRLVPALGMLVWETQRPDSESSGGDGAAVRTVATRGWVAPLDRATWRVGRAAELPVAPLSSAVVDGRLVLVGRTGFWVGAPG